MTKIISLMFHRVNDPSLGYDPQQFARYLEYLINNFPIVCPNSFLPANKVAIFLTFDDAYFDFYQHVYPLLKQYNIRALLAVPSQYIVEDTKLSPATRLAVPYPQGMDAITCIEKVPFCTWRELKEMADSGHVLMASHSYSHVNLCDPTVNITQELLTSKKQLEEKLGTSVDYFVYPYGKMNRRIHRQVRKIYRYGIRIGSALNKGWDHPQQFIYRIDAERLWPTHLPLTSTLINKLTFKYWINRARLL